MTRPLLGNAIGWILSKTVYRPTARILNGMYLVDGLIPGWAIGQTWGDYIFIATTTASAWKIYDHEKIHVAQWHRYGYFGFGFAVRYIWGLIVYGYENHPLEKEARGDY